MTDVTVETGNGNVTVNLGTNGAVAGASTLTTLNRLVKVTATGTIGMATIAESGITGVLTLTKTGTTARTVTFPDAAITVARIDAAQTFTGQSTFTDGIFSPHVDAATSAGLHIGNNTHQDVAIFGAGGGQGTTFYGQINGTALALSGAASCTTLTASGALGAFQYGAQPTGGEDVAVWVNKTSSSSVARSFQSYITHSGGGGSTAYDAVASTSATSGHNVCYQGVSKATGAATPSYLSFAYGSGDSASSGTIADAYGYYWGGWTGAGAITRKWAFFNAATDKSFFGGDIFGATKIGVGVSSTATLGWSMTINHPTAPVLAWQRNEVDIGYLCNASTVFSGKPNTDLAIAQAGAGAVWIGSNGVGMLKVDGTAVTVAAGITCTALSIASADYVYLRGDASTDGSVRMSSQSSGTFTVEARASGVWAAIGGFS